MKKKFTDKEILFLIITEDLKNLTYEELKKVSSFIVFNLENEKWEKNFLLKKEIIANFVNMIH